MGFYQKFNLMNVNNTFTIVNITTCKAYHTKSQKIVMIMGVGEVEHMQTA